MRAHPSLKILLLLIIFSFPLVESYGADGNEIIIAITSTGTSFDSMIHENFGRSAYILLFNYTEETLTVIGNPGAGLQSGAGRRAAETVINNGATHLVTGNIGDKVIDLLKDAGIEIITGVKKSITVKEAIEMVRAGM